jgi:hypothetical protein
MFTLQPWRVRGEPVRDSRLDVHAEVDRTEFEARMKSIAPYEVHELVVRTSESGVEIMRILGRNDTDDELRSAADSLRQPHCLQDPDFGTLVLDRSVNWFTATIPWQGQTVELYVEPDERGDFTSAFETARALFHAQAIWTARFEDRAVVSLLTVKNESWLEDGDAPVTEREFRSRIRLASIKVSESGRFECDFEDGELFWGHAIVVRGTLSDGPTRGTIMG